MDYLWLIPWIIFWQCMGYAIGIMILRYLNRRP